MDPQRYQQVGELYFAALAQPAERRDAFLRDECAGDEGLRREVASLLQAAQQASDDFLGSAPALASGAHTTAQAERLPPGRSLGAYEVLTLLGAGGMGEVYLARDTRLDRKVAIKLLRRPHGLDPERVWRFEREARAASSLNHPNIVTLYDIGVGEEGRFIVMEFVDGLTLRQMLSEGPTPASIPVIGGQIARALAVAHAAGIVHRDVKPENVIVRKDGYVKVLDFGLARLMRDADPGAMEETMPGRVLGTVRYMSPEQARGENSTAASDVFSLGLIFYEIATGHHPFPADSQLATLHAIASTSPARPSALNPGISAALDHLILAMLDKDAVSRPTAAEVDVSLGGSGVLPGLSSDSTALTPLTRRFQNLLVQRTPFIGRRAERAALQPLLLDTAIRLITLTGPGGTGKTRLAVQVALDLAGHFPGGICFVDLAPISDVGLIVSAIAHASGVREAPGYPLLSTVKERLRALGPALLILDNFEQVATAAPTISELLDACPDLKILVTSRVVLRIYGEHEFSVPPLPTPEADASLSPARLLEFPSIALFVQRAAAVKPDFVLTVHNAGAIAEICRRVDGLPLAIELAAARAKVLPPAALLSRIAGKLEVLTGGARDLPERQRTLRRTIDWSHDLLTPAEQKLFRRLSVFVGGCTLEAAEAVCNTQEDLNVDLLEAMTSLVDKSLLRQSSPGEDEPRFTMLETIRDYGRECLERSGETDRTRRAHAAYCLVLAEEGMSAMAESEQEVWLANCDPEHDNFRAAIEYLIASADNEWGLRLGGALLWFWESREHLTEGRAALIRLLDIPVAGDRVSSVPRARALFAAAVLADAQLDDAAVDELTGRSLQMHRDLDDKHGIATVLNARAFQLSRRARFTEARTYLEEALLLWQDLGTGRVMLGLTNLAAIAKKQGDFRTARTTYEKILQAFESSGDVRGIAFALNGLGEVAMAQGDFAEARRYHVDSLGRFRQIDGRWEIAGVLRDLGHLSRQEGDYAGASAMYREALAIFHALRHRRGIARVLEHLACCSAWQSLPDRALKLAGAAAALREKLGTPLSAAERAELDEILRQARQKLTAAEQETYWAEGWSSTPDQILSYALASEQSC